MNREPTGPVVETWQFFSASFRYIGKDTIQTIYKVSHRQLERWSADPSTTQETRQNPLDRIHGVLDRLAARGGPALEMAQLAVQRLCKIVGGRLVLDGPVSPDQPTVELEMLDDYPALAELHRAIREKVDMSTIVTKLEAVKSEVEQTVERHKELG